MIGFHVVLNDGPGFTAGVIQGVGNAGVCIKSGYGESAGQPEILLDVGALDLESDYDLSWEKQAVLKVGDRLEAELVETDVVDFPKKRQPVLRGLSHAEGQPRPSQMPQWEVVEGIPLPQIESPIAALEITIKDRRRVCAGFRQGVVSAMLCSMTGNPEGDKSPGRQWLKISGLDRSSSLHFCWLEMDLRVGDVITITVVETMDITSAESEGRLVSLPSDHRD